MSQARELQSEQDVTFRCAAASDASPYLKPFYFTAPPARPVPPVCKPRIPASVFAYGFFAVCGLGILIPFMWWVMAFIPRCFEQAASALTNFPF